MTKTPEQMAEEFSNVFRSERRKTIAKKSWYTGFEEGLKYASAKWISVNERLPEDHIYYLVTSKKEAISTPYGWITAGLFWDIEIAYFHQKNETWMTGELALNCKEKDKVPFVVAHWMLLPEPPKEEK